ncbi:MAG TPA: alpha/beta family hydrolase [Acidimicrobiales bacterium]|nr:alpha/beta family hydrolase [Acidimicrobiales bacterium]
MNVHLPSQSKPRARPAGLVLTPGASAGRDQSGLVAIDQAVSDIGLAVERVEFPGQAAGKRRPDPPELCITTVRVATAELADRLHVPTGLVAIGGRSMGGRMCSMAVAEGLEVAALVLVSYPLHPPGRPEKLRTAHFPDLNVPCLFVSGRRDAFGTPAEFERETAAIPGPVTRVEVEGDHSLRKQEPEVAAIVASWLNALSLVPPGRPQNPNRARARRPQPTPADP